MRVPTLMMTAAVLTLAPVAAQAQVSYNSAPSAGWQFGSGNTYSPANSAVLTSGDDQLYLRWHVTYERAPVSSGDTYQFTSDQFDLLANHSLSFDWGFTTVTPLSNIGVTLTIADLGAHSTTSYNGFDPLGFGNNNFNDNYNNGGSVQNSARLSFPFVLGSAFDPNADDTYKVMLTVTGLDGGPQSLTTYAKVGDGVGAVPEPASWAMMLGGFGLIGAAMRRRGAGLRSA